MKTLAVAALAVLLLPAPARAQAERMRLGEVLLINAPQLKADADPKAFEEFVMTHVAPAWRKAGPGLDLYLLRADRGSGKGQYVIVSTTDTQERHKAYSAPPGSNSPLSQELRSRMAEFRTGFDTFVTDTSRHRVYHLLSPATAGALPDVDVLGVHSVKVLPERREAFERFVAEKLHPAVANLRTDLRMLYYKSAFGQDAGNYILIFALTRESRDKYWPGGSDSDELRAAFKPLKALADELRTYLMPGSFLTGEKFAAAIFESREWTDFVLVSNMRAPR